MGSTFGLILGLIIVLGILIASIFRVEDGRNAAVVRMGRVVKSVGPGVHFKTPIDTYYKIPSFRLVYPSGNQKISSTTYTKDGVSIKVEGLVHYKVTDPTLFAKNYMIGLPSQEEFSQYRHGEQLRSQFIAGLRAILNPIEFSGVFSMGISSETIKECMNQTMTDFGIEVVDITIENIEPPQEFQETARRLIEQKARTQYLETLSKIMKGESDKLIELLYITESSSGSSDKSLPVKEKIIMKRLAEAETEAYKKLEEKLGPEIAKKLRELQALEKTDDVLLRKKDFEK
jgi:regulator of protease activity HflC (stomatin/prohibitin superfamily)